MAESPDKADSDSQEVIFDGRYKLVSKVGAGGMGAVWLGYDMVLDKTCAIKVLLPNSQAEAFIRFHQEAKMAAKLSHPNIISVFDFGQSDRGDLYLIMDFLAGESLADWSKKQKPLKLGYAIAIFLQICDGLGHAHSQGVLHRDIKPSNIMLVEDDRGLLQVKIVDFGLAKFEGVEQSLTTTGVHVGSPMYMSPEQAVSQSIDHRSDIYSLGCLMFKTLTKRPPFQSETLLDILHKHANMIPPSINEVDADLQFPRELADIVAKTLEKDPADRFQTINELKEALLTIDVTFSLPSAVVAPTEQEEPPVVDEKESKKRFATKVIVAVCTLSICAAFIVYTFSTLGIQEAAEKKKLPGMRHPVIMEPVVGGFLEDKLRGPWHGRLDAEGDFGDEDMSSILRFKYQKHLSLEGSKVTGKNFKILRQLPLTELCLRGCNINDGDLVEIAKLSDLETLRLGKTKIGDRGLSNLKGLQKLSFIDLEATGVTDKGLKELGQFPSLSAVDLRDCQAITGAGLQALSKMNLREVTVANCKKITRQDENRFTRARPQSTLITTELDKISKKNEKKQEKVWDNPHFGKFLKYRKELYDVEFRKFFRQPHNWELTASEISQIDNKSIAKCLKDTDYMKDPEIRKLWLAKGTWEFLNERVKETQHGFDVLAGPMDF